MFDRDDHPRYDETIGLCENKGIYVARSNPCFELWLILHEADYDKPDGRGGLQAHLKSLRPEYDPSGRKLVDCCDLISRVDVAERRAETLLTRRISEGAPFGPPSTTVFELTRSIRAASARAR